MATESGDAVAPLIEELERDPRSFSFFRAVWLLERARRGTAPVGELGPVRDEPVRLRPSTSLAFPSADVSDLERVEDDERGPRWRLTTPLLGLYGVTSPLPGFYTEDILREEIREDEDPARAFLDLANHRLLSLLYRAWCKYRWEFTWAADGSDRTTRLLMGWLGLATPEQQRETRLPAHRLLRYAGALTQRPRSATLVAGVIADWFDLPVHLEPCIPRRVRVDPADRNRLGRENTTLGQDLVVGERVPDRGGKVRIAIGLLDFAVYDRFHPGGDAHPELLALVRFLLPDALAFDLRFRVRPETTPPLRLHAREGAQRLGWTTWLAGPPRSDVVFSAPSESPEPLESPGLRAMGAP